MKVLFATARPPFPPLMGDQLIAYEQIRRLGQRDELHLLTLDDGRTDESALRAALAPYTASVHLFRRTARRWRTWRSLYNGLPVLVNLFYDADIRAEIEEQLRAIAPEVLHVQTIHMAEYFNHVELPKVLDLIDAMSLTMRRRARRERLPQSLVYRWEAAALQRYEVGAMRRYSVVSLVSAQDAAHYPGQTIAVNPNGTYITPELLAARPAERREAALLFHGNMDYFANIDAVDWFCATVWPGLVRRHPALKLYIVGRNPSPRVRALDDGQRVIVTGAVADMLSYLTTCTVGVYPLQAGVGMQNKILEAFAAGLPVVASPLAIQGIPEARDGEHLLVARHADDWIAKVSRMVDDATMRTNYACRAQQLVFAHYSWARNAAALRQLWCDAIQRHHGAA